MTAIEIIKKHIEKNERITKEFTGNNRATEIGITVGVILKQILKEIKEQENDSN